MICNSKKCDRCDAIGNWRRRKKITSYLNWELLVESDIWEVDQLNYWILIKIAGTWDRPKPTVGPVVGGREAGWAEARPTPALLITYKEEHICKKKLFGENLICKPLDQKTFYICKSSDKERLACLKSTHQKDPINLLIQVCLAD